MAERTGSEPDGCPATQDGARAPRRECSPTPGAVSGRRHLVGYFFSSAIVMSRYHASLAGPLWICTQMTPLPATVGSAST